MDASKIPDAITEAEGLRYLNWALSRREELRARLPSVESATGRIYQRTALEALERSHGRKGTNRDYPMSLENRG